MGGGQVLSGRYDAWVGGCFVGLKPLSTQCTKWGGVWEKPQKGGLSDRRSYYHGSMSQDSYSSHTQNSLRSDTGGTFSLFFRQLLTTPHVAFTHARLSWPVGYIGPYKEPLAECQRHSPRSYRANCRARINNLSVARCLLYPSVSLVVHAW